MSKRNIIVGVIILILIVLGYYFFVAKNNKPDESEMTVCTMEALQCPDGSYVGRSGPKCEFKACSGDNFVGILVQKDSGFSLNFDAPKEGTNEVVYSMPIEIKISNALGQLVGKRVQAFGQFSNGNIFVVDHLEELSGVFGDAQMGEISVGQSMMINGVRITLNEVTQDSRCPKDVQCIQAGNITLSVTLQSNTDKTNTSISSDRSPIAFDSYNISIVGIKPDKISTTKIKSTDYKITFKVTSLK